jgi:prepilin-type N-terminal cleavage/methylation domain-containing protein
MKASHKNDKGFTLVEILIAIVVVGILAAVVVVGISSLTSKGNTTACTASRDAAIAGATVHYANAGAYPTKLTDMTGASPAELTLPSSVTVNAAGLVATNGTWNLTMTAGSSGAAPTFVCS